MNDENQGTNGSTSSSSSSSDSVNTNTGNDIPYVPPTDRTNLNDQRDRDTKPFIPPIIKKEGE